MYKFVLCVCLTLLAPVVGAQGLDPDPARYAAEIAAFRQADAKSPPRPNGIVFVGSSTIRLWNTAAAFPGLEVINRGFGGSQISEVNHYVADLVVKHAPDIVVFYAGDNDVNAGKSADRVLTDYRTFVDRVLTAKPATHIVFLAIKPSVARWKLWPVMEEANGKIEAFSAVYSNSLQRQSRPGRLHFVDVATPMLGPNGSMPARSLFVDDGLHLTAEGYALWNKILAPVLTALGRAPK